MRVLVLDPALPDVEPVPPPAAGASAPVAWEAPPAELGLVPFDGAELDTDELGAGELDGGGLAVCDGGGLAVCDGGVEVAVLDLGAWLGGDVVPAQVAVTVTVAAALWPFTALWPFAVLRLAGADMLVRAAPVEVPVAMGVTVTVTVLVTVGITVTVLLGLAPPADAALGWPADVLGTEPVDGTFGATGLVGAAFDEGGVDDVAEHGFAAWLLWPALLLPGAVPPFDELIGLPAPAPAPAPPVLVEESPVALPIWTRASRVGGSARATPTANTAHATARAGRSSPSRQSLGCCRADPSPTLASRQVVQRRVRPARKPPAVPAMACLLA